MTERKIFTRTNENGDVVKLSKTQIYGEILDIPAIAENELYSDFIGHELELLAKKAQSKKSNELSGAEKILRENVLEILRENGELRVMDIVAKFSEKGQIVSSQKISSVLSDMMNTYGTVQKRTEKRISLFSVVADEEV